MSKIEDGGPAFPVECDWSSGQCRGMQTGNATGWHEGLSVRDYFAAKELVKTHGPMILDDAVMYDRLAEHCYRMADAMLRARGK